MRHPGRYSPFPVARDSLLKADSSGSPSVAHCATIDAVAGAGFLRT
jgi:hypothetical protein